MKNYSFHVGIDISKLKLDVVIVDKSHVSSIEHFVVTNNTKGLKRMFTVLKKRKVDLDHSLFCF